MIKVVMALIFNQQAQILIAKRPLGKSYGGLWEFPGGKVEKDETINEAVVRELREELNISVQPTKSLPSFNYVTDQLLNIQFFPIVCEWVDGAVLPNEHSDTQWTNIERLNDYKFADPDYPVIASLQASRMIQSQ